MFKFDVISYSGAIGVPGDTLVKSFAKKEDAKKCARGYNAVLTPAEKKYFNMKYSVKMVRI